VRVTVRLPRSLLGRIDDARQGGEDRSAVLRRLLEAALAGQCQPVSDGIIPAV
jgi:metal-responsive CopG/Arc/MetJ family transcriptional regulator